MKPSGFEDRWDYRVGVQGHRNRVTASYNGEVIADTTRPLLVDEQDHGLVFYFPADDVRLERFEADERTTRCPFKGTATYRRLKHGGSEEVLAWSYDDPYPEVARLAGYIAFYQDVVDVRVGVANPAVFGR